MTGAWCKCGMFIADTYEGNRNWGKHKCNPLDIKEMERRQKKAEELQREALRVLREG